MAYYTGGRAALSGNEELAAPIPSALLGRRIRTPGHSPPFGHPEIAPALPGLSKGEEDSWFAMLGNDRFYMPM